MSRQKGSFGVANELRRFDLTVKQSQTAGKSEYEPHQGVEESNEI